jgi:hypothetical protein
MLVLSLTALMLAAVAGPAAGESFASLEAVLVASADSPAEHLAIASHYRARAADERARATQLREAAKHLGGGKLFQIAALKAQRLTQARRLEASARAHEEIAQQHEQQAG